MKILISDIDKTLYFSNEDEKIRYHDIEKIQQFQSQGHMFGICTGRALSGVRKFIDNPNIKFDFMILSSGAMIVDHNNNILKKKTLKRYQIEKLMNVIDSFVCDVSITKDDDFYYRSDRRYNGKNAFPFNKISDITGDRFNSFALQFKDVRTLDKVNEVLLQEFSDDISIHRNGNSLDIVPKNCNKGLAIIEVQKYYNAKSTDLFAIGDSYNDIPMFEVVGNSFTFNNAPVEVQQKATTIVDSIAESIDYILEGYSLRREI